MKTNLFYITIIIFLLATLNQCSTNTIKPKPAALFSYTTGAGAQITFSNQSTNATGYKWNYGDGSPQDDIPSPTHTYLNDGSYTVTLTVTGDGGTATTSQIIIISNAYVGTFNFNGLQYGGVSLSSSIENNVWITDANNSNVQLWISFIPIQSSGTFNIYNLPTGFANSLPFITIYLNGINTSGAYYSLNGGTLTKTGANSFTLNCTVAPYPANSPTYSVSASGLYPPF
ncbi:MAG: PKD domain-containing protein [Bacteroidetes bacterium]|nr:PKD domain-containing protein [Bacteroidota bacterium]